MLSETLLATKWYKMRGWLWKSRQRGAMGTLRWRRARLGVQMKANHGDCCTVKLHDGKKRGEDQKKKSLVKEKM